MDCTTCHDRILDYLYDEMDSETRAAFEVALEQCADCAREVAELRTVLSMLDEAPAHNLLPAQMTALEQTAAAFLASGGALIAAPAPDAARVDPDLTEHDSPVHDSRKVVPVHDSRKVVPLFQRPWFGVAIAATLTAALGTWLVFSSTSTPLMSSDEAPAFVSADVYAEEASEPVAAARQTEAAPRADEALAIARLENSAEDAAEENEKTEAMEVASARAPAADLRRRTASPADDVGPAAEMADTAELQVAAVSRSSRGAEFAPAPAPQARPASEPSVEAIAVMQTETAAPAPQLGNSNAPRRGTSAGSAGAPPSAIAVGGAGAAGAGDDASMADTESALRPYDAAEAAWRRGDFREAARRYEDALGSRLSSSEREVALYRSAAAAEKAGGNGLALQRYGRYLEAHAAGRFSAEARQAIERLSR